MLILKIIIIFIIFLDTVSISLITREETQTMVVVMATAMDIIVDTIGLLISITDHTATIGNDALENLTVKSVNYF